MIFEILTIFPGMFSSPLEESIVGKARDRGLIQVRVHNIRDFATGKHQITDDRPFGGGEGMVMKPEPIVKALRAIADSGPAARRVLLTPQGRLFDQEIARELSRLPRLILICGRYEGVDERVAEQFTDDQWADGPSMSIFWGCDSANAGLFAGRAGWLSHQQDWIRRRQARMRSPCPAICRRSKNSFGGTLPSILPIAERLSHIK